MLAKRRSRGQSGQAVVEAILTLPLVLFLILGTLQLFLLLQARILAQYAAFQATRTGSLHQGNCEAMTHAAILSLLPTLYSYLGPAFPGSSPGEKLGRAFQERRDNHYANYRPGWNADEAIVWIAREQPSLGNLDRATKYFDQPLDPGEEPVRLEVRLIFWAPLRIPFADWVFSRMALASLGLRDFTAQNPLMPTQQANWGAESSFRIESAIASELSSRVGKAHYVFPIEVSYAMRMMTPIRQSFFATQNCPPAPEAL